MQLTHRFTVPADVETTWHAFNDLERIAPCFPGASLSSYDGEAFQGLVKVKLGPISLQYTGTGRFVHRDEPGRRAVIEAKGRDKRGNGTAAASVSAQLTEAAEGTDVEVVTELNVTGRPAQFGRGVMQDVSDKLLGQFTACLAEKLGGEEPAAAPATAEAPAPSAEEVAATDASAPIAGGEASPNERAAADAARRSATTQAAAEAETGADAPGAELDLGATVLPVLAKRYAPYVLGALVVLLVLKRLLGSR